MSMKLKQIQTIEPLDYGIVVITKGKFANVIGYYDDDKHNDKGQLECIVYPSGNQQYILVKPEYLREAYWHELERYKFTIKTLILMNAKCSKNKDTNNGIH